MATRSSFRPQSVITNGNMAGNLTSVPTILQSLTVGSYGYSWAGTAPVGALSVQISNDYSLYPDGAVNNPGTWTTIWFLLDGSTMVQSAPVTGNTGEGQIEWSTSAYAIRTVYAATSGVGTIQAVINGKVA